jgi:hypothetical protein
MAAEALPAPITMVRPRGAGGTCGGTQRAGNAASMAARNMSSNRSRGGMAKQGSISFLKKRNKKLLLVQLTRLVRRAKTL